MATNPPGPLAPLPSQVPSSPLPAGGASPPAAKPAPDALTNLIAGLAPAVSSSVSSSVAKGLAAFYASTAAFAIAVVDLKFNLGLGHTFDAGLIGAGLSALLGKAITL